MESLSYHYERNPADPRISHALTLEVDAFGNPLKSLAIGYGRRQPDPALPTQADRDKQTQTLITYTENRYTNGIDDPILRPGQLPDAFAVRNTHLRIDRLQAGRRCPAVQFRRMGGE